MSLKELEKKMAELEKLQAETENAHAKLKAQMAELEKLQAETENAHANLIAQFDELKAQNEEKPKPPHPRWKPERDEHYYTIDIGGACAGWETWDSDNLDGDIYSLGFVFKTEAEAEFAIERLKVLAEMQEWAGHNYDGAYIYYHRPSDEIMVNWDGDSINCFGDIRFKCVDDALNCVEAVGKERLKKYYFMIPEGKTNE